MSFAGRVVLVTGAARGIGRAAPVRFAQEGAGLALVDLDVRRLGTTDAAVRGLGARSLALGADVGSWLDAERLVA